MHTDLAAAFHAVSHGQRAMTPGFLRHLATMYPDMVTWQDKDRKNQTLLMAACFQGNRIEEVRMLLALGADVHARDMSHRTALHIAAIHGQVDIMRALHGANADLDATDNMGITALWMCVPYQRRAAIDFLLAAGANPNIAPLNESVLHLAVSDCRTSTGLIKSLLEAGASRDALNRDGDTPLQAVRKLAAATPYPQNAAAWQRFEKLLLKPPAAAVRAPRP